MRGRDEAGAARGFWWPTGRCHGVAWLPRGGRGLPAHHGGTGAAVTRAVAGRAKGGGRLSQLRPMGQKRGGGPLTPLLLFLFFNFFFSKYLFNHIFEHLIVIFRSCPKNKSCSK